MALLLLASVGSAVAKMAPKVIGAVKKIKGAAPKIGMAVSNMSGKGMNFGNKLFQTSSTVNDAFGSMGTTQNSSPGGVSQNASGFAQYLPIVAIAAIAFLVLKK